MALIQLTNSMTEAEKLATQNTNNSYLNSEADAANKLASMQNMYANGFINGDMQVWQRGTTVVPSGSCYTADMWQCFRASLAPGLTVSQVAYNPSVARYALRAQRDSGNTSLNVIVVGYSFSTAESLKYIGKYVTASFSLRKGTNAAGTFLARIVTGTGTDENLKGGITGWVTAKAMNFTPTTTDQIFTLTTSSPISSSVNELELEIDYTPSTATAGANDYIEITNCNWSATDFYVPFSPKSYAQTLTECNNSASVGTSGYQKLPSGLIMQWGNVNTTDSGATVTFPLAFATACYNVQLTIWNSSPTTDTARVQATGTPKTTMYVFNSTATTRTIYWLAIGI